MNALATRPSEAPQQVVYHYPIPKEFMAEMGIAIQEDSYPLPFAGRPQPTDETIKQDARVGVMALVKKSVESGSLATAAGFAGHMVYTSAPAIIERVAAGGPLLQNLTALDLSNPLITGAALVVGIGTAFWSAKSAIEGARTTKALASQALLFEGKGNPELPALRSKAVIATGAATQLLSTGAVVAASVGTMLSQPLGWIAGGVAAVGAAFAGIATWVTSSNWAGMQRQNELNHEAHKAITAFEAEIKQLRSQESEKAPASAT